MPLLATRRSRLGAAGFAALMVSFVGAWEGLRLTSYPDVVGVWTACYGETHGIRPGQRFSKAECDARLIDSLKTHERGMLRCLTRPLPDEVHGAFLSLTYNIGVGAFCKSTAARLANAGDLKGACAAIQRFNKAGGVVWKGLVRRRAAEYDLCMKGL
ncbi:lysozyme [Agaricicola taiwanensis]|uniref:Lysozyme n=1 Tax=Agaricicola taiwanensis TaxID=591372 RepID=A0A8J2YN27_9RHOB|nr:lysozyme [Agaricicola taiwanensis]GGE54321.1 lysozyme [Agaricicola taiwanensis]